MRGDRIVEAMLFPWPIVAAVFGMSMPWILAGACIQGAGLTTSLSRKRKMKKIYEEIAMIRRALLIAHSQRDWRAFKRLIERYNELIKALL